MVRLFIAVALVSLSTACGGGPEPSSPLPTPRWDPARLQVTRAELTALMAHYDSVARVAGDAAEAEAARRAVGIVRQRLEQGDFRPGDRILLRVEGEESIPDTVVVEPGPSIVLAGMEPIALEGVLRSELESHLTSELARYVRDPRVTARSMVRLSVQGAVVRPGFYVFPADMLLQDVIMSAGGPARDADLEEISLRRGERILMANADVRTALADGRSIDQLNLQGGDEMEIPRDTSNPWVDRTIRWGVIIVSTLLLGIRLF